MNCNDLRYFVPLAQSTISRHLKELYDSGVLGYNVIGNNSYYHINQKALTHIIEYLTGINSNIANSLKYETVYYKPKINHKRPYFMRI